MKSRFFYFLTLLLLVALPVQAGFWDSLKKGLGIKGGDAEIATQLAETVSDTESHNTLPPPLAEPIPAQIDSVSPPPLIINANANAIANETRGLKALAKDRTTQQQNEVKLYDKSYAVIIGIDQYKHLPPDRQLKFAVRDAKGIEATLKKHYQFDQVFSLFNQDATRARIIDLLTGELPPKMGKNDALFVFFAGHGDQIKSGRNEIGYLIPHDGQVGRLSSVISMADLRDTVSNAIPAKHIFYVVDACYGGLLTTTRSIDKSPRRDLAYLKEIAQEPVRQVLTAGGKGEEVLDGGPNGHSVFTGRLIEALEQAGDFITANEIQGILREKVYGDARARNHTQTPAYGTLSGSGDFVFIPSLKRKTADNRSEIAQLEAELKALDVAEAKAKTAASRAERERQQAQVEQARKAAEGKLKAEQLKQQQLAAEEQRRQAEAADRARLLADRDEDEKRLAELKAAAEARRKNMATLPASSDFPTLASAVAEIRRLNQQITQIEARYQQDLADTRKGMEQRHTRQLAALDAETKDEFESQAAFKTRIGNQRNALLGQHKEELGRLNMAQLAEAEVAPLRVRIQSLAEREYIFGEENILVELGNYDAEQGFFPVALRLRPAGRGAEQPALKLAFNGTLPLPPAEARQFKQHWAAGLVRAEVTATPEGGAKTAQLVNEADGSRFQRYGEAYITEAARARRKVLKTEASAAEQERMKQEFARLQRSVQQRFNDDLQPMLARAPAAKADKHLHVLAIGIDDYADVPDVPFADRSAKLFAEMARKTLGAQPENIITLTNQEATSGRLRGRLRTLLGRLTPEDRLLIYFAGHGVPAQDGKNVFLLAQDGGSGSFEEPDLQLNALYAQVGRSRVGQAQLFIDACFSGRSNKDSMILGGTAGVAIVPKHGIRSDSRLTVMIAGRAEQLSNQHEARGHRLFGYHLMHALLNDGLKLSAGEIHHQIRGKVLADSLRLGPEFAQEPELLGNPAAMLKR